MKRAFSILFSAALAVSLGFSTMSCSDGDDPDTSEKGSLSIQFDNVVGSKDLKLNSETYQNSTGETFTVTTLNYFVSNFKLLKTDGTSYTVPQDSSYFLIRENNEASQLARINNIPAGDYKGIEFIIGVDSTRSVSDVSHRKGILDKDSGPVNEEAMYWDWNPGYIFLKMEGNSDFATSPNGKFYYHIGGFGGWNEKTLNNIRTVKIDFGSQKATVANTLHPQVSLSADVLKIFDGPTKLSIKENSAVMFTDFSRNIADNYVNMFSLKQIQANQ